MIKLYILDDQLLFANSLKALIDYSDNNFKVTGLSDSISDFLNFISNRSNRPDILLISINLPNTDYLSIIRQLKKRRFKIKILVLISNMKFDMFPIFSDSYIDGIISKKSSPEILFNAINEIALDHKYFPNKYLPIFSSFVLFNNYDLIKRKTLTKRELELLDLISKGFSNKEIAIDLCITESTVKNHISSIFEKIGCTDRTHASLFYLKKCKNELY